MKEKLRTLTLESGIRFCNVASGFWAQPNSVLGFKEHCYGWETIEIGEKGEMGLWKTGLSLPASDWVTFIVDFASELFAGVGHRLLFSGGRGTIVQEGWGVNSRERGKTKKGFFSWATVKRVPLYIFSSATVPTFCYSNFQFSVFSFQRYPNGP